MNTLYNSQEGQDGNTIRMEVLEVIQNGLTEIKTGISDFGKGIIDTLTLEVDEIIDLEYNDLLIRGLYLLDGKDDIPFDDFILELELINKSEKYDISREIKHLKANSANNSKCSLNFNIIYGSPSCVIHFKHKSGNQDSISVKFTKDNNN